MFLAIVFARPCSSATNIYSYTQYLYTVAIVATIDLDAPDPELVDKDSEKKSSWLLKNCVVLRLQPGETFYKPRDGPAPTLENAASLFAQTVKRRRQEWH